MKKISEKIERFVRVEISVEVGFLGQIANARLVATCRGERLKTSMCPWSGRAIQAAISTVVDLPEPFGPSRPKTSPRRTSKSTLSTARALGRPQKSLKTLVRPRTETTTLSVRLRSADCGLRSCVGESHGGIRDWVARLSCERWRLGRV